MTILGGGSGSPFGGRRRIGGGGMRLVIAAIIMLVGIISYYSKTSVNPATGEKQRISLSAEQETVLGLEAAPQMAQQMGGEVDPQHPASQLVERLGQQLVANSIASKSPYKYDFHLLADPSTINAFALPGGQVFITRGLFEHLQDEAMLAGVLGHEIAHVVHRHSAEQMAKGQLGQLIVTGVGVAASESQNAGQLAAMAAQLVNNTIQLRYSREHETESDSLGLRIMTETGFDPRAMIDVMKVLQQAAGGRRQPEFLATHPDPGNRIEAIERWLKENPEQAKNMTRGRSLK